MYAQELEKEHSLVVKDFINCIKHKNWKKLARNITYPLRREYPLPGIKSEKEFLARHHEVFDDSLIKIIVTSKLSRDWSAVGWRGIMLFRGDLWLDYDGSLIGVNYNSKWEIKKRKELIEAERTTLHPSLRNYEKPMLILETSSHRIRIDDLGDFNYRYVCWRLKSKMSDPPDLIIEKGEWVPEGSGGNYHYEFKRGKNKYECSVVEMGEDDSPPAWVTIYIGEKELLAQRAKIAVK